MKIVTLGEVCTLKNGRAFKKTEWVSSGLPIIRIQNLNDKLAGFNYFNGAHDPSIEVNAGDLLFSWSGTIGTSFGPHIWDRDKAVLNQHIYLVTVNKNLIDQNYLYYYLKEVTSEIEKHTHGAGGLVHVTKQRLVSTPIPLPLLEDQRHVVARLDEAFEKIDRAIELTQQNLKNSQKYPSIWLNKVFAEKSINWENRKLYDLVDFKGGGTPSKANPKYWTGHIPWVSPKDMKASRISDSIDHISENAVQESSAVIIPKNSILLVVRSGILAHTIPLAINTVDVTLNQDMKALILKQDIEAEALYSIMLALREKIFTFVSKGATVHRINFDQLKNLRISFPSDRDEQIEFAKNCKCIMSKSHELETLYKLKIEELKSLKQSMLQQVFNDKVDA